MVVNLRVYPTQGASKYIYTLTPLDDLSFIRTDRGLPIARIELPIGLAWAGLGWPGLGWLFWDGQGWGWPICFPPEERRSRDPSASGGTAGSGVRGMIARTTPEKGLQSNFQIDMGGYFRRVHLSPTCQVLRGGEWNPTRHICAISVHSYRSVRSETTKSPEVVLH